jgi:hypothetical protein
MFVARMMPSITDCAGAAYCPRSMRLVAGVVRRDHRERERRPSAAIRRSRITPVVVDSQPPLTPASSFGALGVQGVHQVAAVVDDQVRARSSSRRRRLFDVPVVRLPVHPGPGEDRDALVRPLSAAAMSSWVDSGLDAAYR